ncbi:MAG TPA: 2-dehydro-3-deoxy-D-gluconate 5-dehydrogenase KduD [Candidatus Didemnitutus sp.]|nr:2-dehydro-3-deoxy-D-gluconate 5-dehydrogenase KduD [Candidatus Didemnitutus sp.]
MPGVLESFRLDGKVAIVTGASRGLGAALAVALAEAGADVALVARSDTDDARRRIEALGRRAIAVPADLAAKDAADHIMAATVAGLGQADILVNNAGIIRRGSFLEFSESDWRDVLDVNLDAAFRLSQRFARHLVARKSGGKIVHVASMLSYQGGIRVASYTAAKSALHGLTKLMANELAPLGINVNAIAPGYMATDNTAILRADTARNQAILERIPAGRWGEPDDLKGAVVFLASESSRYMHGFTLAVDGGWLAR